MGDFEWGTVRTADPGDDDKSIRVKIDITPLMWLQIEIGGLHSKWKAEGGQEGTTFVDLMRTQTGRRLAGLTLLHDYMMENKP